LLTMQNPYTPRHFCRRVELPGCERLVYAKLVMVRRSSRSGAVEIDNAVAFVGVDKAFGMHQNGLCDKFAIRSVTCAPRGAKRCFVG
jgi:hypothetical protein